MEQNLCILTDIEKRYGAQQVLGPVSLCLKSGVLLGIRGSNGAGKSTLLNIMAGVTKPDGGTLWRAPETRGAIGYAPQDIALYGSLTGMDNLLFWCAVSGLPAKAAKSRARWLLETMQLSGKAKKRVDTYSGGMKRRLNLACALVTTPKMLLLDEPFAGADTESVTLILDTLRRLKERGCAVAVISHQTPELDPLCDRIITLEAGKIVSCDKP